MNSVTIYHNPKCSKSRETLALLQTKCQDIRVIEYLRTPLSPAEIATLLTKLKLMPLELVRKGESVFKEIMIDWSDTKEALAALSTFPILIERPIVETSDRAIICRPPSRVEELFH
jgi:arsenate reductase (glutaredoxin)